MSTKSFSGTKQAGSEDARGRDGASGAEAAPAENVKLRSTLETIMKKVDESEPLKKVGETVSSLTGKVIKPGKIKDLVSGTWLGHPAHPMLTDLPIGFWTSSFVLDLVGGKRSHSASDALIGMGVAAALPTAITGLSDLADVGEDEGLRIGAAHAVGNTAALLCYALSLAARKSGNRRGGIALSTAGAAFATAGGYLGGHLAYRRGVGVNRTAFTAHVQDWTKVIAQTDLEEGKPQMVRLEDADILLYRSAGEVYALANRCSHRGGPLHEGEIHDGKVTCPWHGSTFSLEDGSVVRGPATAPQPSYEARLREGAVEVRSGR